MANRKSTTKNTDSTYTTLGGVGVHVTVEEIPFDDASAPLIAALDSHRGVLLSSSFEFPERYTRWDMGFVDPPIEISCRQRRFRIRALNDRGRVLLPAFRRAIDGLDAVDKYDVSDDEITGTVAPATFEVTEELRSRQPSVFSVMRAIIQAFSSPDDRSLGLYGALGYDLAFQFDPIELKIPRDTEQRDLVLFLPDEILVVNHHRLSASIRRYDFEVDGQTTAGLPREGSTEPFHPAKTVAREADHAPGEYADVVQVALGAFKRGDLFEVVPGQTFFEPCLVPPSEVFKRLKARNPAPYGTLMNLGEAEYLVGASPEMFVRVSGSRIETCPISGTIARGTDAIGDAIQILKLLNSAKDESELTMCTDVDRNDKSRVCDAGSVRVIGRRQIEMYSRLIHTVDHVEGRLRPEFDALDGFLAHTWAVTVTGAPKRWAMQFIEDHERSERRWYGGAIGFIGFNGSMNTGLTLRTMRIKNGTAEVRAGATLLYDSDPESEEAETRLKASALIDALRRPDPTDVRKKSAPRCRTPRTRRVLVVDHEDSFVHTLAGYLRETGAEVVTFRADLARQRMLTEAPDLVLLSPGPGRPEDFDVSGSIETAIAAHIPVFGVCLGFQGIVEHFGGCLGTLPHPVHGKAAKVIIRDGRLFKGISDGFTAGRYHSLFAIAGSIPADLEVTAVSDEGVVMAVEHRSLPIAGFQFHPESILSLEADVGRALMRNIVGRLSAGKWTIRQPAERLDA